MIYNLSFVGKAKDGALKATLDTFRRAQDLNATADG